MRVWWAAAAMIAAAAAGCATTEGVRVDRTASARPQAVNEIERLVDERKPEILACFQQLAARRGPGQSHVRLHLRVGDGGAVLLALEPLDRGTVVDESLTSCLGDMVARWRIAGKSVDVALELDVAAREAPAAQEADARAEAPPAFHPEE